LERDDLVYPDLSYKIVGVLFEVYNELGHGLDEKVYQRAMAVALKSAGLIFQEQVYGPLSYKGQVVGRKYFDFLIDKKVILEIKKGDRFSKAHMDQVLEYLHASKLKLGILAYFSPTKLHFKRLINL